MFSYNVKLGLFWKLNAKFGRICTFKKKLFIKSQYKKCDVFIYIYSKKDNSKSPLYERMKMTTKR